MNVPDGDNELSDEELLEEDLDEEECVDLFSKQTYPSSSALVAALKEKYDLDLKAVARQDEYLWIRTVNFCRREVAKGTSVEDIVKVLKQENASDTLNEDDSLLQPVMPEDAFLYAFDEVAEDDEDEVESTTKIQDASDVAKAEAGSVEVSKSIPDKERIIMLEDELASCRAKIRELLEEVIELDNKQGSDSEDSGTSDDEDDDEMPGLEDDEEEEGETAADDAKNNTRAQGKSGKGRNKQSEQANEYDNMYFESYSTMGIHEEMLKDRPRTEGYRDALDAAIPKIPNATVLDVGCGTGILSMFSARAGAKRVIGVDASAIAELAQRLVTKNGFEDTIKIVNGRVEELENMLGEDLKVDLIVSEWMGYGLLFESMLDSVLDARDRWLKPGGVMVPNKATIYLQGQSNLAKFDYWRDVYGFDYSELCTMRPREPLVEVAKPENIVTDRALVYDIDIAVVTKEELDFTSSFTMRATKDAKLTSFVISFDCGMVPDTDLVLSTAVESPTTHWAHTVLYLEDFLDVKADQELQITLSYKRNERNKRDIDMTLAIDNKYYKAYTLK